MRQSYVIHAKQGTFRLTVVFVILHLNFTDMGVKRNLPAGPLLNKEVKNYLIDIDGTITDDIPNEEWEKMVSCLPYPDALETINRWYDQGHIICFFTSRTEDLKQLTIDWLDKHGFKYHSVLCGKPRGGNYHWIDNHLVKATRFKGKFTDMVKKEVVIEVFKD